MNLPPRPTCAGAPALLISTLLISTLVLATLLLSGCASTVSPVAGPPYAVPPLNPPVYVERVATGGIFQPQMVATSLFSSDRRPRGLGDTLKVDIAEKLSISRKATTETSRANNISSKGPGGASGKSLLDRLINLDATASGKDGFKGSGAVDDNSSFTGQIAAQVINVLPNGNLVVAGERSIALNGSIGTLRFAGLVNPQDIKAGNIVSSTDVVNARFEVGGEGDVQDATGRTWVQRILTRQLAVW